MVTLLTNCSDSLGTYSFKSCIRTEAMVLSPVLTQYDKGEFFFTMVNGPSQLSSNLVLRPDFLMYTFCPFSNSLIFDFASQVCFLLAELCLKLATASLSLYLSQPTPPDLSVLDRPGPTLCTRVGVVRWVPNRV